MAKIIPSIEDATKAKQPPTEGEIHLLKYLEQNFDTEAEVYFQPCFNGDRPDIVIIKEDVGVIIIEVKDWNLDCYEINGNNQWLLKKTGTILKSPFAQVFSYKNNLFEIHANGLLERKLKNERFYGLVRVYVYFHNATKQELQELYREEISNLSNQDKENGTKYKEGLINFEQYEKTLDYLASKKSKFSRDSSTLALSSESLKRISFQSNGKNPLFTESVYLEFIRLLRPPIHYANEGKPIAYTKLQSRLCESTAGARVKIRGTAGSGKTTILAKRAVNAHKRHGGRVLILTYNLTLCMYIKDKISEVREDFSWANFEIINYHKFMMFALNGAGVKIEVEKDVENAGDILDEKYFSNTLIFSDVYDINKYDTILVDEVQDYKPEWLKIIKTYFLNVDGEMVLFGDEKQNIYGRPVDEQKKTRINNGFGEWEKLTKSFRYKKDSHILSLAVAFQNAFFSKTYELEADESYQPTLAMIGINAYGYYSEESLESIAKLIVDIAKRHQIHPNDISILSSQEKALQGLDYLIRNGRHHTERTITTFEALEVSRHEKYSKASKKISSAKKIGFNLNSGVMKLSTIHSFKGYESPNVFLFIHENDSPEVIYTGLTRAKENIVVFLNKGSKYTEFFEKNLDDVQSHLSETH